MGDGAMLGLLRGCVCDADDVHPQQFHKPLVQLGEHEDALEIRVPRPKHLIPRMQTYSSSPDQPLLGVPIREGTLWHLSAQDPACFSVSFLMISQHCHAKLFVAGQLQWSHC
ncbi:unnamed protein product [Symbiodinium natans]|uniref:Uncharacterized protein n=1 Tax=Symbiodinium natans TaxID=878477 RepID=A0A812RMQ8_9DINO|nr:unnamed protein product [Symbiodinium natans]